MDFLQRNFMIILRIVTRRIIIIMLQLLACSILENLANKSSGIDQSKISKFSLIRTSFVLLGSTLLPICRPQRRQTWAGVLPNFSATIFTTGCLRTSLLIHVVPGEPNGEYPLQKNKNDDYFKKSKLKK